MDFIFGTARKAGESLGIVDEVEEVLEDQDEVEEAVPQPIKVAASTIKPVGKVPPYIKVIDPAHDLSHLQEAFGVYHVGEKMMELVCPDCGHCATTPFAGVNLEDDCTCVECDWEAEFDDFYEGSTTDPTTSRKPTLEEVTKLLTGSTDSVYWIHGGNLPQLHERLMTYYSILMGQEDVLGEGLKSRGVRDDGYNGTHYVYSCSSCQDANDNCFCSNDRMRYFGRLHSIKAVDAALEAADDMEDD